MSSVRYSDVPSDTISIKQNKIRANNGESDCQKDLSNPHDKKNISPIFLSRSEPLKS